ncbi:ABC transporter substrate-binding protein [Paenibacillus sp. NEAU-GSW1]|uniref:ABC transporter substrate-binding protein n=1 Tax=Paenibacillus sp. NEAU-GSW1 TaxID=2682486 RepID=UPI0020A65C1F|nr:sugar ABC transporter substrate-binding protein [Paenibacillus sp. NEAU-GSW1]
MDRSKTESGKAENQAEQVTLRYSSYLLDTAQASKVYYDAIREFEAQNPNIKIEADFIQNAGYMAGVKIRLLGGVQMDVFDTWSPSLFEEFRKLNNHIYLDLSDSTILNDFVPNSLKPVTIGGKVYGAPEVMHSDGLLYNKTMFKELGLTVPQTWDEFLALCEEIKRKGIIPVAMDSDWSTPQFFWGSIMSNNGADEEWTRKLEQGEIPISDPIFVDAIQKHKEIIDRGFVPTGWMSMKHEQSKDLLGQGKAAMMITGTWDIPSVMERNPNIEIEFMMVPGEERTVPNINVGTYRVINAKTEHPEEAKKFIAFMNSKATQQKLADGALAVPSIISADITNPVVANIAELVTREDATLYWPHTVSTESLQVKIQECVNKYLAGESLELILDEIQQAIDSSRK